MERELIIPEGSWRARLGVKAPRRRRLNIRTLNAVPTLTGGLHRWLHRQDLLTVLYREAERLESADLKTVADRIAEVTAPKDIS